MAGVPKYKNAAEMQEVIDMYFENLRGEPATMAGLASAMGFASRQSFVDYKAKNKAFSDTITRARLRVEAYAESRLFDRDGARGAEFTLKCNFGWRTNETDTLSSGMTDAILEAVKKI